MPHRLLFTTPHVTASTQQQHPVARWHSLAYRQVHISAASRPPQRRRNPHTYYASATASAEHTHDDLPEGDNYAALLDSKIEYLSHDQRATVFRALDVARKAHEGQRRKSGEPYIVHPVAVAELLAGWHVDCESVVAGLLHDTVEDTQTTLEDLERLFGMDVRKIVEGETKLSKLAKEDSATRIAENSNSVGLSAEDWEILQKGQKQERKAGLQADYLRNMFLAMTEDVRVIIVKLADRLHNMRTLDALPRAKQLRIAKETMEIFAPLAHRLGMFRIKTELENLCFKYLYTQQYEKMLLDIATMQKNKKRQHILNGARNDIEALLLQDAVLQPMIRGVHVTVKMRGLYELFRKEERQEGRQTLLLDLLTLEIVVHIDPTVADDELDLAAYGKNVCYHALGRVHSNWKHIPGKVKDYVANPKPNGYQGLHTKLALGPDLGFFPVEVQIRTDRMQRIAENGIVVELFSSNGTQKQDELWKKSWTERVMLWLRSVREYCDNFADSSTDLVEAVRSDLLGEKTIFVFTPKGQILDLPEGSSVIDLAYKIHSEVGDKMLGASVNGTYRDLSWTLRNADLVHISTSNYSDGPTPDWLKYAKTSHAQRRIRRVLRARALGERIETGREILHQCARDRSEPIPSEAALVNILPMLETISPEYRFGENMSVDDLYCAIADCGESNERSTLENLVFNILREKRKAVFQYSSHGPVFGEEIMDEPPSGTTLALSRCCQPVLGDNIVGCRHDCGGGISIHRTCCPQMHKSLRRNPSTCVSVHWGQPATGISDPARETKRYPSGIVFTARDFKGLLSFVSGILTKAEIPISGSASSTNDREIATLKFDLLVKDRRELGAIANDIARRVDALQVRRLFRDIEAGHPDDFGSEIDRTSFTSSENPGQAGGHQVGEGEVVIDETPVSDDMFRDDPDDMFS